ncbi:MAG: glycosyl hydrolase family 28 protein [Clostridia bacterium]|nr:glycosyl hydrolase family 28 protein [Clostridia bacterium]
MVKQMKNIFYASECGAKLNSNVISGGGDDDTEAIQKILNKAQELGSLHLIIDGAALVSGLTVYSNTTIECTNQSNGFFLKDHSNKPIIINSNPNNFSIQNENISILGGTYNGNNLNQDRLRYDDDNTLTDVLSECIEKSNTTVPKMVMIIQLIGVKNVIVRDVILKDQRRWAFLCCNFKNVTMENILIDLEHHMQNENQDGLHFWGPGEYLTLKNIQGRTGDDFIALAPDEGDWKSSITDVLIDGVILHDADQGIRLLSRNTGSLDRILIKNVIGTYKSFGFYVNNWFPDSPGGNFGSIIFENINLVATKPNYDYTDPVLFQFGGKIQQLILRNINVNKCDNRSILKFGYMFYMNREYNPNEGRRKDCSKMKCILIDGLHIEEKSSNELLYPAIDITNPIENLIIRNCEFIRCKDSDIGGCFINLDKEAEIDNLSLNNINLYNVENDILIKNGCVHNTKISALNK